MRIKQTLDRIPGVAALKLVRERSAIGGVAEASTAGNAVDRPEIVALAAASASARAQRELETAGALPREQFAALADSARELAATADRYAPIAGTATAQISISVMATALLCPLAVILYDRWQRSRGIDAREELSDPESVRTPAPAEPVP